MKKEQKIFIRVTDNEKAIINDYWKNNNYKSLSELVRQLLRKEIKLLESVKKIIKSPVNSKRDREGIYWAGSNNTCIILQN